MGNIGSYRPEKLVTGVLSCRQDPEMILNDILETHFGIVERIDGPYRFTFTDYYEKEMGSPLWKLFFTFKELVVPDGLAHIKQVTNSIEDLLRKDGGRTVNLDPGLLSESRFMLATTKDRGHRIPIGYGMYAEVTLIYEKGLFQPLPWTYADFRSEPYRMLLKEIRKKYLHQIKSEKN